MTTRTGRWTYLTVTWSFFVPPAFLACSSKRFSSGQSSTFSFLSKVPAQAPGLAGAASD